MQVYMIKNSALDACKMSPLDWGFIYSWSWSEIETANGWARAVPTVRIVIVQRGCRMIARHHQLQCNCHCHIKCLIWLPFPAQFRYLWGIRLETDMILLQSDAWQEKWFHKLKYDIYFAMGFYQLHCVGNHFGRIVTFICSRIIIISSIICYWAIVRTLYIASCHYFLI